MARPKEDKKDILILYETNDSEDWISFIEGCFTECPETLNIEAKDLASNIDNVGLLSTKFTMILLIISPKMLQTLQEDVQVLLPTLQSHRTISVLKLYIDDVNFDDEVVKYYSCAKKWKCFSIGNDDGVEQVQEAISHIIDVLQDCKTRLPPPPKSYFTICPDCIRQGGEKVTLVLRKSVAEDQKVQVRIGTKDTDQILDTERLNEYCFQFKAPAHAAGKATLYLFLDGRKKYKQIFHYSSMTRFAYTYPEFLCQLIGLNHDDKVGLDRELTGIFKNSAPQDGTLEKLLTPKVLQATSTTSLTGAENVGELPTLLHFACKYGLNDLAVSIIDSPGSYRAIHTDNDKGFKPIHLAEENNNEELVNYIEAFMEMHDYVTEAEEIYERMSGGKLLGYDNSEGRGAVGSRTGYLHMQNQDRVDEAYARARLIAGESDYEIKSEVKGLVDEVSPEDDVAPEVPARPRRPVTPTTPSMQNRKTIKLHSSPAVSPANSPPDDNWHSSGQIPADDKIFSGGHPMSPNSMGSQNLDELQQYAVAYKNGDFGLDDIERLFQAWHARNKDHQSLSLKERKAQIEEFKKMHASKIPKKKGSLLPWKKKAERPNIEIEHHVEPNKYESWTIMRGEKQENRNRSSCDSCISNASSASTTSSSSRDSALERVMESDSDQDVPQEVAPPVPRRVKPGTRTDTAQNRTSWGDQYLFNAKKKAKSRLPTPPSQKPNIYSHRKPTTPVVPPRPPRS